MDIPLPMPAGIVISIVLMSVAIVLSAGVVLRVRPLPYLQAFEIAAFSYLLGRLFVSVLQWPDVVSYSLAVIAQLFLSYIFFNPTVLKLVFYWILAFALYLLIHLLITSLLGWTFMFPFWAPKLLG
jgi:hypothetical protein